MSTMHDITGLDHEPEARAVLERGLQLVPSALAHYPFRTAERLVVFMGAREHLSHVITDLPPGPRMVLTVSPFSRAALQLRALDTSGALDAGPDDETMEARLHACAREATPEDLLAVVVTSGGVFVLLLSPEPDRTCADTSFPINSRGGDA